MNYILINKKWTKYFNWTVLYPSILLIIIIASILAIIFKIINSNVNLDSYSSTDILSFMTLSFGFGVFLMLILGVIFLSYIIWFILASDELFKLLKFNRFFSNLLNLIAISTGLFFLTPIIIWFKIKNEYDSKNIEYKISGKIKN